MRKKSDYKHIPYFRLLEAAKQPGCSLCRLISGDIRRHLDYLLYEYVNDVGFRYEWRQNKGFCHRHSWMLAESADGLGLSILYLDLLKSHGQKLLPLPLGQSCSVCIMERNSLKSYVNTLIQYWPDPGFIKTIEESEGLCLPHLRVAKQIIHKAEIYEKLEKISLNSLAQLSSDLELLIDSFDYQHSAPDNDRVKLAWRRAIEKIAGCRESPENNK